MTQAMDVKARTSRRPLPNITFSKDDPVPENNSDNESLIITTYVEATRIHKIYVDVGSSTKIMYKHCIKLTSE